MGRELGVGQTATVFEGKGKSRRAAPAHVGPRTVESAHDGFLRISSKATRASEPPNLHIRHHISPLHPRRIDLKLAVNLNLTHEQVQTSTSTMSQSLFLRSV